MGLSCTNHDAGDHRKNGLSNRLPQRLKAEARMTAAGQTVRCKQLYNRINIVNELAFSQFTANMSKSDFGQNLLASSKTPQTAVDKIPIIARHAVSDRAKETLNLVMAPTQRVPRASINYYTTRSRNSSKRSAFQRILSFTLSSVKERKDGGHIPQSSTT